VIWPSPILPTSDVALPHAVALLSAISDLASDCCLAVSAVGQIRPNEVLALMGPSGSGKTSLLTVLGGRSAMKFKGQSTLGGILGGLEQQQLQQPQPQQEKQKYHVTGLPAVRVK
jgi:ABC-type uncharacterized transport system YnjBCD ATPase subunit